MLDGFAKIFEDTQNFLPRLPEVLLSLLVGILVVQLLVWFLGRALKVIRLSAALIQILCSIASVILWVILISHILRLLGLSQVAITLSGSLLVLGLAIANGAHSLVSDVIAGLFLARDRDFGVGRHIKFGNVDGVVEAVDLRKTRVRTVKGTRLVIPNAVLDKEVYEVIKN